MELAHEISIGFPTQRMLADNNITTVEQLVSKWPNIKDFKGIDFFMFNEIGNRLLDEGLIKSFERWQFNVNNLEEIETVFDYITDGSYVIDNVRELLEMTNNKCT